MGRAVVKFTGKHKVCGITQPRNLLLRLEVYDESSMDLFDSDAKPNLMSHKMVHKLQLFMKSTNRTIKLSTLNHEPVSMEY